MSLERCSQRRKLLVGAVCLIPRFKLRNSGSLILQACNEIEEQLVRHEFLKAAPFTTINLILRYGAKDDFKPSQYRINNKHDDLEITVELEAVRLKGLEGTPEQLTKVFRKAIIGALCEVGAKYGLPYEFLFAMRSEV